MKKKIVITILGMVVWLGFVEVVSASDIPEFCRTPILFVHGYFAGPDVTWGILLNRMKNDGCPEEYLYAPEFDDRTGCNPEHGLQVKRWVETLVERTGFQKINIIAHSMGALDTRYYIKYLCGYRRIKNVVTIGGANHGTVVACSEPISCGAESMCRGSSSDAWRDNEFLAMINSCDETPGNNVMYTSIWSAFDEIIRPPESSIISGAWNVKLHTPLVGHWSVIQVGETYDYIKRGLTGEGKNTTIEPEGNECVTWCPPIEDEEEAEPTTELESEEAIEQSDGDEERLATSEEDESLADEEETSYYEESTEAELESQYETEQYEDDAYSEQQEEIYEQDLATEELDANTTEKEIVTEYEVGTEGMESIENDNEAYDSIPEITAEDTSKKKSNSGCNSARQHELVMLLGVLAFASYFKHRSYRKVI